MANPESYQTTRPHKAAGKLRLLSPRVAVDVTEDDILHGVRNDAACCVIAEALKRVLPVTTMNISVDMGAIRWTDPVKNVRYAYITPRICQIALVRFDRGVKPQPFSFRLRGAVHLSRAKVRPTAPRPPAQPTTTVRGKGKKAAGLPPGKRRRRSRKEVMEALNNPNEQLGLPVLIDDHDGGAVKIGGKPPVIGNLARKRRFGACIFLE